MYDKKVRKKNTGNNKGKKSTGKYGGKVRGKVTWFPVTSLPVMGNGQILHMDPPQMWLCLCWYTTHGVRVARSLAICVCFVDRCLTFWTFSFDHCVCSSSNYGFCIIKLFLDILYCGTCGEYLIKVSFFNLFYMLFHGDHHIFICTQLYWHK